MKSSLVIGAILLGLVAAGFLRRESASVDATARDAAPAKRVALDPNTPEIERDAATVFQRAFWRRPSRSDRIVHAERREWKDANGVFKWQWFVAVDPSRELRDRLFQENAFDLAACDAREVFATIPEAPAWFLQANELPAFAAQRNREGRYLIFFDAKTNRLFATDRGHGFATAAN